MRCQRYCSWMYMNWRTAETLLMQLLSDIRVCLLCEPVNFKIMSTQVKRRYTRNKKNHNQKKDPKNKSKKKTVIKGTNVKKSKYQDVKDMDVKQLKEVLKNKKFTTEGTKRILKRRCMQPHATILKLKMKFHMQTAPTQTFYPTNYIFSKGKII
eukprot:495781_1